MARQLATVALLLLPFLLAGCQELRTVQVAFVNDGPEAVEIQVSVAGAGVRRERVYHLEPGSSWSEAWLLPDGVYALRLDDTEHPVHEDSLDACRVSSLVVSHDGTKYTAVQGLRGATRFC
jgi:hypothetical protein